MVEIVTLTGALSDTGEDRVTSVGLGDVVDELLNEDGLSDTGTSKETNLSSTGVGGEQVDDCTCQRQWRWASMAIVTLDAGNQDLGGGGLVNKLGGLGVNGGKLGALDGTTLVNGITSDVHDATESAGADGNHDGVAGIVDILTTGETLGT